MTVSFDPAHAPAPTGEGNPHDGFAGWAVRLSAVSGAVFGASVAAVAIAYAAGAESAVEDTLLGWVLGITASTGFLGSLAGFVAAIVAKIRRERWTLLWLPLSVFPAMLAFLVFGEAFWWE
jgi:hypothetical protein